MMSLNIPDRVPIENFVIENNIIKGVHQELPESYQIGKLLFDTFDSKPNHVVQIEAESGEQTTFKEMQENSVRCALWLRKEGIGAGDIVTICAGIHLNTYIPLIASFYIGATYNPWNNRVTLKEAQHLMKNIKPKIIFVTEQTADVIIEAAKLEHFDGKIIAYDSHKGLESLKNLMKHQAQEEVNSFYPLTLNNPEDIAYILMSSGTTGFPKGVTHTYGNLVKQIVSFSCYSIKGIALWYSPLYWIAGFMHLMQIIFNKGTSIVHGQFDPEATCKVIEKYKVDYFLGSATTLGYFCKSNLLNTYQLQSLKLIMAGGSKISKGILEEIKIKLPHVSVSQITGSTETGRMMACQTENSKSVDSVGFVNSCSEIKIRDLETNEPLEANQLGEMCFKSVMNTKGYLNNEAETKATIDKEGWLHTGDIAYYDENGEFFIVDRLKEIMKYQNVQVSPNEIEDLLLTHPSVLEVAVVPIPHEIDGDRPMAFVKKAPNLQVTEEELIKFSESLGEMKKLHGGVKFVDDIPKTPTGKIARQILKEMAKKLA